MAKITESSVIAGVVHVVPEVHGDARGRFIETYRRSWFAMGREMIQGNRADRGSGSVVGLHYHLHQADYWYVTKGHARMVLHDLRVGSPTELVDVATAIFREDLDAGYVAVLVEMIAGASSTPGLGPAVSARLGPWFSFAERAVTTTLGPTLDPVLPAGDVAYGIVALYLGLEMLTHLDGDRARALGLFAHAKNLAGLLEALAPPAATRQP